jgi:hypothetical protein
MFSPIYISTQLNNGVTSDVTGDYSSAPVDFIYQVPSGKIAALTRIIIRISDGTTIDPDVYGGLASPLTNGITVSVKRSDNSVLQYLHSNTVSDVVGSAAKTIKENAEWAALCYDYLIVPDSGGLKEDLAMYRWTFARAGMPLILSNQEKFCITANDNFTDLIHHTFTLQGLEAPENSHNLELFMRQLSP